jgi:predicted RecB family endonuclease
MTIESNKLESSIIQLHKNELPKVTNADVIAMANVMKKLEETTANLPSKKVNEVVDQLKDFMETLAFSDCEAFARDVRRMMDNLIEVRQTTDNNDSDDFEEILKEIPKDHPWLNSSAADDYHSISAMKKILNTIESANKLSEINIDKSLAPGSELLEIYKFSKKLEDLTKNLNIPVVNTDVNKRLSNLENKIDKLLLLIDSNFISGITTLLEDEGK